MIFIGNYVADSLCHDAVRMPSSGGVQVAQMKLTAQRGLGKTLNALQKRTEGAGAPTDAPSASNSMHDENALLEAAAQEEVSLSFIDVQPEWVYEDAQEQEAIFPGHPVWDAIVRRYRRTLTSGCVMMPVGALTMLEAAQRMTGGNALVLLGDKGYTQPWEMGVLAETGEGDEAAESNDPHVAVHGSVSMMVNFDAISQWATAQGAVYACTDQIVGFKVATVVMSAAHGTLASPRAEDEAPAPGGVGPSAAAAQDALLAPPSDFDAAALRRTHMHTLFHFKHAIQLFSPEDFATLQRNVKQEVSNPTLRLLLALLRLGAHDGDVFMKFKAQFIARAAELRRDDPLAVDVVAQDVPALQTAFFPMSPERDLHFELGRVCMGLGAHDSALELFQQSNVSAGEHHVTWHNIGLCHWFQGSTQQAVAGFQASLELQSDYAEAAKWLAKAEERLALDDAGGVAPADVPVELEDSE